MSNALCITALALAAATASGPASQAATGPAQTAGAYLMIIIVVLGICAAAIVAAWATARPNLVSLALSPDRPNKLNILHILAIFALFAILVPALVDLSVQALLRVNLREMMEKEPGSEFLMKLTIAKSFIPAGMFAMSLAVAAMSFNYGIRRGLGFNASHLGRDVGRGVIGFLAVTPVCLALQWVMSHFIKEQPHILLQAIKEVPPEWKAAIFVAAGVLAPLAEETFFRGLLQSYIRSLTRRPWSSILVTSAVFTVMHSQYSAMPALFVLAIVLGWSYERSGRLVTPMVIHGLFNMTNMITVLSSN